VNRIAKIIFKFTKAATARKDLIFLRDSIKWVMGLTFSFFSMDGSNAQIEVIMRIWEIIAARPADDAVAITSMDRINC